MLLKLRKDFVDPFIMEVKSKERKNHEQESCQYAEKPISTHTSFEAKGTCQSPMNGCSIENKVNVLSDEAEVFPASALRPQGRISISSITSTSSSFHTIVVQPPLTEQQVSSKANRKSPGAREAPKHRLDRASQAVSCTSQIVKRFHLLIPSPPIRSCIPFRRTWRNPERH